MQNRHWLATPVLFVNWLERSADIAIVLAYIIRVSLYLNFMSAFVPGSLCMDTPLNEKLLTSSVVVFIVIIGMIKGLHTLDLSRAASTYGILALALSALALYYLLQCLLAIQLNPSRWQQSDIAFLALVLAFIVLFAVPAS